MICGVCGITINGVAYGLLEGQRCVSSTCGPLLTEPRWCEPWRPRAFPAMKDLIVDRTALDRIISAVGFVSTPTGAASETNRLLAPNPDAEAS